MATGLEKQVHDMLTSGLVTREAEALEEAVTSQVDNPEVKDAAAEAIARYAREYVANLTPPEEPAPKYSSVVEFVDEFLVVMYPFTADRAKTVRWTPQWWRHPEAVMRIAALWNRYEELRVKEPATFMETFLRVHADYHMRQLMAPEGVFDSCKREDQPSIPLPSAPMTDQTTTEQTTA